MDRIEQTRAWAVDEARRLGHRYVGTEHVLLAVARAENVRVGEILVELGLEPEDLRSQVDAFVIKSGVPKSDEDIPISPRAQRAFDRASDEATAFQAEAVEAEHVLVALAQDEDGVAARVLEVFGIDYASIRRLI